jgi:hypothetical protein
MDDYGWGMGNEELAGFRYQEPFDAGWWKTSDGWGALLRSQRIDRRAKPVVVAFILVVFVLASRSTEWSFWGFFAGVAVVVIAAVLFFSPIDPDDPTPRRPLEPGWWKTRKGWPGLVNADLEEPGVGVFWMLIGTVAAALSHWGIESETRPIAIGTLVAFSGFLFPERYRMHLLTAGVLLAVMGGALI